jgi:RNA polymerase sigma factor for flagellar operon FliA
MPGEIPSNHRLIESHRSYAHAIAAEILKTLPSHVEKADLQAAAELGLTEAASSYDHRPGVQFKTFAYYRIRGAVYDAIRKATWFSRGQHQEIAAQAAANEYMSDEAAGSQAPVSDEAELGRHVGAVVSCFMLSLEGNKIAAPVDRSPSAEDRLIQEEWSARLHKALPRLADQKRKILEAYYFEGRNLEDIGASMGLSKSWVCRLHAKAIAALRDLLAEPVRATVSLRAR